MSEKRTARLGLAVTIGVAALIFVLMTPGAAQKEQMAPVANHYKCYPILDWTEWEPRGVKLQDQFGRSEAKVLRPYTLCNPVDKNGEGIADKDNHLVCYAIQDDPSGEFNRVKEVQVQNQFGETTLWLGLPGKELCVPSKKREVSQ